MYGVEALTRLFREGNKMLQSELRTEIARRKTHEAKILTMLKLGEQVDTTVLRGISANHTARISGLRSEGHKILTVYRGNGVYEYFYKGHKDDK